MSEQSLVIIKPDGVERNLIGEIIKTFECANLKIVAMKMINADEKVLRKHYEKDNEWKVRIGEYVRKDLDTLGLYPMKHYGIETPIELGQNVIDMLVSYMMNGKVVPMIVEGDNAVEKVRNLVGSTYPATANPGSIRGKFSSDSNKIATLHKRSVYNLLHASGEVEEAEAEIKLWFPEL